MEVDPIVALQWALDQLSPADLVASTDALSSLHGFLARGTRVQRLRILGRRSVRPAQRMSPGEHRYRNSTTCSCKSGAGKRKRCGVELQDPATYSTGLNNESQSPVSLRHPPSPSILGSQSSVPTVRTQTTAAAVDPGEPTPVNSSLSAFPDGSPEAHCGSHNMSALLPQPSSSTSAIMCSARQYFEDCLGPRHGRALNLLRALQGFMESAPPMHDFPDTIWVATGSIFDDGRQNSVQGRSLSSTGTRRSTARLQRLFEGHRRVKEGREKFACAARFCHIYLDHDLEQLLRDPPEMLVLSQGRGRVTAGLELQATSICTTVDVVKAERKAGRNYARLLALGGPGYVLRVGCNVSTTWERKLSKGDLVLVLDFIRTRIPELARDIEACNSIAARALLNGLLAYGWTRTEILETDSTLFDILKQHTDVAGDCELTPSSSSDSSSPASAEIRESSVASTEMSLTPDFLCESSMMEQTLIETSACLLDCDQTKDSLNHAAHSDAPPGYALSLSSLDCMSGVEETGALLGSLEDIFSFNFGT